MVAARQHPTGGPNGQEVGPSHPTLTTQPYGGCMAIGKLSQAALTCRSPFRYILFMSAACRRIPAWSFLASKVPSSLGLPPGWLSRVLLGDAG